MEAVMSRDDVAKRIHWNKIIWFVGLLSPTFMLPQAYKIWDTKNVSGISLNSLWLLLFIQIGFTLHGYFQRDRLLQVSSSLGAMVNIFVIVSVSYLRQ